MSEEQPSRVLVSTTQRCGSSWIASICCRIIGNSQRPTYVGGLPFGLLDFARYGSEDEEKVVNYSRRLRDPAIMLNDRVFKTHDLPPRLAPIFLEQNPDFVVINVVRDFRDILISRLMYNRYYLPTLGTATECKFVAENAHLSDIEMARQFYGTAEMLEWLANWKLFDEETEHDRYLRLRYEDLLEDGQLKRIIEKLVQLLLPSGLAQPQIDETMAACTFENIELNARKSRKQREVKSDFCRKGVSGDHERYLTKHQSAVLKLLTER